MALHRKTVEPESDMTDEEFEQRVNEAVQELSLTQGDYALLFQEFE